MSSTQRSSRWHRIVQKFSRWLGADSKTVEELLAILRRAEQRHLIDFQTFEMLEGVLEISQMKVRDVMIPRGQMEVLSVTAPLMDNLEIMIASGHSRFPVIGEHRDQVLGLLLAKDLLKDWIHTPQSVDLKSLIRPVALVPQSKRLDDLLREFRTTHNHMVMVTDEYGGIAGLVTIEDVLEQIVGNIEDEFDYRALTSEIEQIDDRTFLVNALMKVSDFNEYFNATLTSKTFDTLGGFVIHHFGYLPKMREAIQIGDLRFEVEAASQRRVKLWRVHFSKVPVKKEITA